MTLRCALAAALTAAGLAVTPACLDAEPPAGPRLAISVAPLSYPGITNASYALEVQNKSGQVVSSRALDSRGYGAGDGAISYVGTCDATPAENPNTVLLTLTGLYAGPAGDVVVPPSAYHNPGQLARDVTCLANADTAVTFDLTLARAANQGFFDVAVAFSDIYCSAKLDCVDQDDQPLALLHRPDGARGRTVVLGLACTGDLAAGGDTYLFRTAVVVTCAGGTATVDPSAGPGNLSAGAGVAATGTSPLFGAAVYRGAEQLGFNKRYWNVLLGLQPSAADCVVTTAATASPEAFAGGQTPAGTTWPIITWDRRVTAPTTAALACTTHPVDGAAPNDGVYTEYTGLDAPETFAFSFAANLPDLGQDAAHAAASCAAIVAAEPASASGSYWVEGPTGAEQVWCAMPSGTALRLGAQANASWSAIAAACPSGWQPYAIDRFERVAVAEAFAALQAPDWYWVDFFAGPGTAVDGPLENQLGWVTGAGTGSWNSSGFADAGATALPNLDISGNQNAGLFDPVPLSRNNGFTNRGAATVLYNSSEQTLLGAVICTLPDGVVGALTAASPGRWADGTEAATCDGYLHPSDGHTPATEDGVYVIDPDGPTGAAAVAVTCDMTRDGGGWTLIGRGNWMSYAGTVNRSDALPSGYILTEATMANVLAAAGDLFRLGGGSTWFYVRDASPYFTTHYWRTAAASVQCATSYAAVAANTMATTSTKQVSCDATAVGLHSCGTTSGWILLHQNDAYNITGAHPCGLGSGGNPTGSALLDLWVR